jgi:hypothetical protein
MPRPSTEILAPARAELARGRPRVALKELEAARVELMAARDLAGLGEALELALKVPTLAPVDARSRERLVAALEQDVASLAPNAIAQPAARPAAATPTTAAATPGAPASAPALYTSLASTQTEKILASPRAEIERGETRRALRSLEKARRKLLERGDAAGLGELLDLAQRMSTTKARHEKARRLLIDAAQQNVRYLSRREAIKSGQEWSDPFATAQPKATRKLPSLPPMSRREILTAACIVVVLAGAITAWTLASRAPQRVAHAIACPTGDEGSPTWSPDGKRIAFAKNGSCGTQIQIISARGGRARELTKKYGVLPDWSPNGRTILFRSSDGFSVVAAKGGKVHLIYKDDGDMGASWSPDGKRIAFVHGLDPFQDADTTSYYSTMYTMKSGGSDVHRLLGHSCNPGTPAWSPDGGRLAFTCNDGVYVMRLTNRSLIRVENGDFSSPYSPRVRASWSPDGRQIAIAYGNIEIFNAGGSGITRNLREWDSVTDVAWSPDGQRLAFVISGYGPRINGLYVIDRDGSHRRLLARF